MVWRLLLECLFGDAVRLWPAKRIGLRARLRGGYRYVPFTARRPVRGGYIREPVTRSDLDAASRVRLREELHWPRGADRPELGCWSLLLVLGAAGLGWLVNLVVDVAQAVGEWVADAVRDSAVPNTSPGLGQDQRLMGGLM